MIVVRGETPADYAAIADLHARAFGNRAAEAIIVALLRQRADFDPALSLVAEDAGRIAGHALFSPRQIMVLGQSVRAVNLAPLAVDPAAQGRGVGGRLIEEGHARASDRGHALSFLLGHPSYYPRFGYRTFAYGSSVLAVPVAGGATPLAGRPPTPADLDALRALHAANEGGVDFAIVPDAQLLAWVSPDPQIIATVFERDGEVVGYVRVHQLSPAAPRVFLASDAATAHSMVSELGGTAGVAEMTLPLHPASPLAAALGQAAARPWESAMACSLLPNPFDDYYELARRGERPAGRIVWPVEFDLA